MRKETANELKGILEPVSRYNLDGQRAGVSVFRRRAIADQIKQVNVRGIVLYGYVGCSFSGIDREIHREYFRKHGTPGISLEGASRSDHRQDKYLLG